MSKAAEPEAAPSADLAALARGGRINFFGFILRLIARLPFLFIAGRIYGADELGRFTAKHSIGIVGQSHESGQPG